MILEGNPVSQGVAIGLLWVYKPFCPVVEETFCTAETVRAQLEKWAEIQTVAQQELQEICGNLENTAPQKAKIFAAHQEFLHDAAMEEEIKAGIKEELWACDWAVWKVFGKFAKLLEAAPDPVIRERAADVQDVGTRLLRIYYGVPAGNLTGLDGPAIVAASDLLPSDTVMLNRGKVLAIITENGSSTSHSAILARSYGIPAVLGVPGLLGQVQHKQLAVVDALQGKIILNPGKKQIAEYEAKRQAHQSSVAEMQAFLPKAPHTKDGVPVDIGLNIGTASEEELAGEKYTGFVGLLRTEFMYMGDTGLPDENTQFEAYKKVLQTFAPRPVTLRTLDIGGDKTLASLPLPPEDNPFLGNRALRLCFSQPALFRVQLRAALRASAYGQLWLMLPMVSNIEEIRKAKAMIADVKAELLAEGVPVSNTMKIGIMVEIPSIALLADRAAEEVDFASIGTNDLCQYLMAADRLNPAVAGCYQSYHPALLRMVGYVARQFNKAQKPVGICGELGADPLALPVLVGLGLRKFSMGISSVAAVKRALAGFTLREAETLAKTASNLTTADEVEACLNAFFHSH